MRAAYPEGFTMKIIHTANLLLVASIVGCSGESTPETSPVTSSTEPVEAATTVSPVSEEVAEPQVAEPQTANVPEVDDQSRGFPEEESAAPEFTGRRLALLVGCTEYDALSSRRDLNGPANDVILLRHLLLTRYGFQPEDVTVLAEQDDIDTAFDNLEIDDALTCERPTRNAIMTALQKLADEAEEGDTIFILLSGHGCRQPAIDSASALDVEKDGLDELFLPCDIGRWNRRIQAIENAIVDDELESLLSDMVGEGAFVFFVADSCHSGTVTRGEDDEDIATREVDPVSELGVPAEAIAEAREAGETDSSDEEESNWFDAASASGGSAGLVALYAVMSHQEAIESRVSPGGPKHGRLSYAIYDILNSCERPISYRELNRRILWRFAQRDWISKSTPGIEGAVTALNRVVLEKNDIERPPVQLLIDEGRFLVSGGSLHDLTVGSVLAVEDPDHLVLGHVLVTQVLPLSAVVEPIAWGDVPRAEDLPEFSGCRLVYREMGSLQLPVGLHVEGFDGEAEATARTALTEALQAIAANDQSLVRVSEDPAEAAWIAVGTPQGVFLQKADSEKFNFSDEQALNAARKRGEVFGPYDMNDRLKVDLQSDLGRIARAVNLLKLAEETAALENPNVKLSIEVTREGDPLGDFESASPEVHDRDRLVLKLKNDGYEPVSIVVFYVDNAYQISSFFPRRPDDFINNKIGRREELYREIAFNINAETLGWEHVVIVAVPASQEDAVNELVQLQQEQLQGAATRSPENALTSPLARLIDNTVAGTRGDPEAAPPLGSYSVHRITWNVTDD